MQSKGVYEIASLEYEFAMTNLIIRTLLNILFNKINIKMASPIHVTDDNFQSEVLESSTPVIVDFWATWCAPCRKIAPIMDDFANEYNGKLKVCKLDVDNNQKVAMNYGIRSIPTVMIFQNGQAVDTIVGAVPKDFLIERVSKYISSN
jgi:thioredoxin 1